MSTFRIIYTCKAENDLDSIFSFIAENNPLNALNYINRMQSAIENLVISPYIGVSCRSKRIKRDCRILIFTNYLIFYKVNEEKKQINILRILHGSRRYLDLLN